MRGSLFILCLVPFFIVFVYNLVMNFKNAFTPHAKYGAVPCFGSVLVGDLKPLLLSGMDRQKSLVDSITVSSKAPSFDDVKQYLKSGKHLNEAQALYDVYTNNLSDEQVKKLETEMQPVLAAHQDLILLNKALFARLDHLNENKDKLPSDEAKRLVEQMHKEFVRSGAALGDEDKKVLKEINQELSKLYTEFSHKLLKDEESFTLLTEKDLEGLSAETIEGYKEAAKSKGKEGYVVFNTRSSVTPFLTTSTRRDLREQVWRKFVMRGDKTENDTSELIKKILALRLKRAKLLGFQSHAHLQTSNTMCKTPERALDLLMEMWNPAIDKVKEEVEEMEKIAKHKIEPWDYYFYSEKVRKASFDLDMEEVGKYFEFNNMKNAIFYCAKRLFGMNFNQIFDVPTFHEDVQVFEVSHEKTGNLIGLYYLDPFARPGTKSSGAWMMEIRCQENMDGNKVLPIVSNSANFIKGKPGDPILISYDDATTLFHEFGHAMHGLLSNVTYSYLSGTNVVRDYVEFPSQVIERWVLVPEVLELFAKNSKGETLPKDLVDKILKTSTFNKGFDMTEYLSSAIVDLKLHLEQDVASIDPNEYEKKTLSEIKMPSSMVMRHRTPQFAHVWSSDGYSSLYWSYLWSDVLSSDAWESFEKDPFNEEQCSKFYNFVFSKGNTIDPAAGFRQFKGRDPTTEALKKAKFGKQ